MNIHIVMSNNVDIMQINPLNNLCRWKLWIFILLCLIM